MLQLKTNLMEENSFRGFTNHPLWNHRKLSCSEFT